MGQTGASTGTLATLAHKQVEAAHMALHPHVTRDIASDGGKTCIDCGYYGMAAGGQAAYPA